MLFPSLSKKSRDVTEMYALNPPYLESRLETLNEKDLAAKLDPIRAQVTPLEPLDKGDRRVELSLPVAILLIATLAVEGWPAQRFSN